MGFFQSLKQDLSEAVGELIGEEDALEGAETAEDIEGDDVETGDEPEIAEDMADEITDEESEEYDDELADAPAEEIADAGNDFLDEGNTAEELDALLKDVIQPADEPACIGNEPAETAESIDAEAAAAALFDSLAAEEGLSFADDSNEVDLAEKLAEEAYKAEIQAAEDVIQANTDVADGVSSEEAIASLDDIDLNKMLENIQGELNAVQEESLQADEQIDAVADIELETSAEIPAEEPVEDTGVVDENVADVAASLDISTESTADEDMLDGQMSLEEMMAMAESLTNENGSAAESASVDNAVAENVVADEVSNDTLAAITEDVPVTAAAPDELSDVATEPVVDAAAADEAVAPADNSEDVSAGSITADFNAEVESELQNQASGADAMAVSETSAVEPAVMTDASEPATESADSEPAKEKKAKKTTRKKKAKADVSADIGAEDLAGRVFSDETAHLSDGMMIRGNIISDGNMEVAGEIDGNIDILGKLNVSGTINGNTKAGELYAEGAEINGNIECSGSVKVGQGAVIIGDVAGTSAVIAGAVKGNIDVHGPVILADSAIVMGDIRSASVQISNGAAVEGMCSQIYAEVSPKNFFKDLKKAK